MEGSNWVWWGNMGNLSGGGSGGADNSWKKRKVKSGPLSIGAGAKSLGREPSVGMRRVLKSTSRRTGDEPAYVHFGAQVPFAPGSHLHFSQVLPFASPCRTLVQVRVKWFISADPPLQEQSVASRWRLFELKKNMAND